MQTDLVFSVIAADRTGLVRQLAGIVAARGGSWVESSMARLGGEFAGVARVSVPEAEAGALAGELLALSGPDMDVHVRQGRATPAVAPAAQTRIELTCTDQPGIVKAVAGVLAEAGASIDSLETEVQAASMSGEPVFRAVALARLPAGLDRATLEAAFEALAGDLMADISVGG